ncbi:putative ankyrin repeat domain protein [Leptodontidium sp. 2 PMI_412]|nr:putative ankyrin repeat domain protein [Leptodontidium sp. 2 PMI_412]
MWEFDFGGLNSEQGDENDAPKVTPEDLENIRLWLSPTEFESEGSEYRKHLNAHVPGTGNWLFQTEQYMNWHNGEDNVGALWIQGIPGSGKSVAAANLVQTLKSEEVLVLFFFSRRIIKSNSEPRFLVRDSLHQLLDHSIALQRRLKSVFEQHPVVGNVPFHELWRILIVGLSTIPKVYLVFDALDELATEEDGFLQCLLNLAQTKPDSIKLIMTSRPLPHLQTVLKSPFIANIRLSGHRVKMDITTYITHRLSTQKERSLSVEDQCVVKDVICQKADNLFLYARLMLDELFQQSTPVLAHLQRLPSSLEDMYVNLLHEHSSRSGASLHFQSLLLSCVAHASRPLRVTELAALINSHGDRVGLNASQEAKLMVRTSCGPLLEILNDETVQVIHHSFTEFLLDNSRSSAKETTESDKWFPAFTPALAHRSLMFSCIDYLKSGCFDSWSVGERLTTADYEKCPSFESQRQLMVQFQFLQYASQNLLYHAVKCDAHDIQLAHKLDELLQYGSHDFESWKDFFFAKEGKTPPDDFHPLHVASQAGLTAYTVWLLGKGADPNLVDSQMRTAAAYAAMYGHSETLAVLLNQNASFTIKDWDGLQPIHHSSKGNHVDALRCLLDAGANPMSPKDDEDHNWCSYLPSTIGITPIQLACEIGNADVVTELLEHLEPSLRSDILPHWASATGQAKPLSVLFQYPQILANINRKDICGNTAIYLAACIGDSATVRILLDNGADMHGRSDDLVLSTDDEPMEETTGFGRTPLQGWSNCRRRRDGNLPYGSVEEWERTGTLLIEAGSDIEARDEKGQTVLFAWKEQLRYGRGDSDRTARFVSLLLKNGANLRATDNEGNTPLHLYQKWHQNPKIVGLFIKGGADINTTRQGDLATSLIARAKAQCTDVEAYIDNGADFNMQDSERNTALHYICRSWLFELSHVKEWLLAADPTIKNRKGETCVYNLRYGNGGNGRVEAIPLLVEKGLDLESRNRLGRTALLAACASAERHFILGLIRYGANAKSRDFQNKSCLHLIAQVELANYDHGSKDIQTTSEVIKSLIKAGGDINGVDFDGNTPFMDAVESNGYFSALKIRLESILKFGGMANTSNHRGQTALHKVAALTDFDSRHHAHGDVPKRIDFLLQHSIMAIHIAASTSEINTWKFADDYRTPLHFAAGAAQSNSVGLLCKLYGEKSGTVDQRDENGRNSECVYYLLQSGASPNAKDNQRLTPLHLAAQHQIDTANIRNQRKFAKISYHNEVSSGMLNLSPYMDMRKESPFHKTNSNLSLAICQDTESRIIQDVARLLLSAGADPTACDKSGQTPYDVAIFLNNEDMVNVLSPVRQKNDTEISLADQWYSVRSASAEEIVRTINVEGADAYTLLQTAIVLRNESVLDALLKAGVDPATPGPAALTPVHIIAHFGLISMMKIVASHVDLNTFSPSLIHVAASREQSNIQMIDLLIELGVDVSSPYQEVDDERRRSTGDPIPSYAAAHILAMGERWWNISALESLCKAGADLEMPDGDGNTVLQCALNGKKSGSWGPGFWRNETLEVLLRHDANVNAVSPDSGSTPLTACLESRRGRKLVQKLLDAGADINLGRVPAIFEAIESEDPEATAAILDAGGDFNAIYSPEKPKKYGQGPKVETPLLSAALKDGFSFRNTDAERRCAREEIIAVLLERGGNPLLELQDGKTTVLHEIAYCHGLIAPILKTEIDLEVKDSQHRTPLLAACGPVEGSWRRTEDESTPRELILAGANIHITDAAGSTPLHLAVQAGLFETTSLLLEKGAFPSAKNNAELSPLSYALKSHYQSQLKFAKVLLSAGAEHLFTGPNGESPLHLLAPSLMYLSPANGAEFRERVYQSNDKTDYLAEINDLYQQFVDHGCDRNARDHLGNTPLFPYVKEIKHRNDYWLVEPPAEEDVRKMFESHDVLAVNDEGDTLLHAVASRQEGDQSEGDGVWLFKELMVWGVDPKKENKKGASALDIAAACGKQAILEIFAREEQ